MNDTSGSSNTSYVDRMLATYGPTPGANPPPHSLGHPHRVVGPVGVNSDWAHSGHNDTSWAEFGDVTVAQGPGLPYPPRIPGLSAALQWVEFLKVRVSIAHHDAAPPLSFNSDSRSQGHNIFQYQLQIVTVIKSHLMPHTHPSTGA